MKEKKYRAGSPVKAGLETRIPHSSRMSEEADALSAGRSTRQASLSQVETPNLGSIYNWSKTQNTITPNNIKSCDIWIHPSAAGRVY